MSGAPGCAAGQSRFVPLTLARGEHAAAAAHYLDGDIGERSQRYDRSTHNRQDSLQRVSERRSDACFPFADLRRHEEALASYDRALALRPDYIDALNNRGNVLRDLYRFEDALASYERVLALRPDDPIAFATAADCVIKICDWSKRAKYARGLPAQISAGKSVIPPFLLFGYSGDPALQLQCARHYTARKMPMLPPMTVPPPSGAGHRREG